MCLIECVGVFDGRVLVVLVVGLEINVLLHFCGFYVQVGMHIFRVFSNTNSTSKLVQIKLLCMYHRANRAAVKKII